MAAGAHALRHRGGAAMNKQLCSSAEWENLSGNFIALWTSVDHAYALFDDGLVTTALMEGAYPALSPHNFLEPLGSSGWRMI